MTKSKTKIVMAMLVVLLSSCSVSKMRYSRGFNVHLFSMDRENTNEAQQQAVKAEKKQLGANRPERSLNEPESAKNEDLNILSDSAQAVGTEAMQISKQVDKSKFWNFIYTNADKAETKFNKAKQKRQAPDETHGDGTGGGWGIAGFVLSLLGIFVLGIIFSCIGMGRNRKNRGLAIAGLIIGIIWCFVALALAA